MVFDSYYTLNNIEQILILVLMELIPLYQGLLSHTFLMYAPFDNPKYSMVVISPNISNINGKTNYRAQVNRLIARDINDFLLSNE